MKAWRICFFLLVSNSFLFFRIVMQAEPGLEKKTIFDKKRYRRFAKYSLVETVLTIKNNSICIAPLKSEDTEGAYNRTGGNVRVTCQTSECGVWPFEDICSFSDTCC